MIINKTTLGAGQSRNIGIKRSSGKYIAFCDADDLWKKTKLEIQLKFMEINKLSFSHSSYDIINHKGNKISHFIIKKKIIYRDLLKSCDIGLSTIMCTKKILKRQKFANIKTKEDYYLWLNLLREIRVIKGMKQRLSSWRKLENSLSSPVLRRIIDAYLMYKLHTNNYFVVNIFYTLRLSIYALIKKIKLYR